MKVTSITNNNPDEQRHLLDTEQKTLVLLPKASNALRIAAFGHDIDRSIPERRIYHTDYQDYEEYKKRHALESANIMKDIVLKESYDTSLSERVFDLIKDHERGDPNDYEKEVLMTADSLSFFDCNISQYEKTHTHEDVQKKILFMYCRMLETGKLYLKNNMPHIQSKYIDIL